MNCLFSDVASCEGERWEHLIQECVGGTRRRRDIICRSCNDYFGREVDPGLGAYYMHLIDTLRPLMPPRLREKTRHARFSDGKVPLILRAGGLAELAGVHKESDATGRLNAISSSPKIGLQELKAIANAIEPDREFRFSNVPLARVTDTGMSQANFIFSDQEYRAAVKSILEIADWQTAVLGLPHHIRSPALRSIRDFVRNGRPEMPDREKPNPMYDLEEEMQLIFSDQQRTFSNRVLVCNDTTANRSFGMLQIANTMPIGICLGLAVGTSDFTVVYEKGLIANEGERSEVSSRLLIDWRTFHESRFLHGTKSRNEFAFAKMHDSLVREMGRALLYLDMNYDKNLLEWFRHAALCYFQANESDSSVVRALCEQLLRLRFRNHDISNADWNDVLSGLDGVPIDSAAMTAAIHRSRSLSDQAGSILMQAFRDALQKMVERHGLPKTVVIFGNIQSD